MHFYLCSVPFLGMITTCSVQRIDHFQANHFTTFKATRNYGVDLAWRAAQKNTGQTQRTPILDYVAGSPQLFPCLQDSAVFTQLSTSVLFHSHPCTRDGQFLRIPPPALPETPLPPHLFQLCVLLCFLKVTHQVNSVLLMSSCPYWKVTLPSPEAIKVQLQFIQLRTWSLPPLSCFSHREDKSQ